ncbi:MAG: acyl-ACP--UDP-N-acetylglucosamine O-acyltransferase [Phycisphaerales bacterium]
MPKIHPSAIIDDQVTLADDVQIGPNCTLTGKIALGNGVKLIAGVYMQGPVTVGADTVFYPNSAIGFEPQDAKFAPGSATAGVTIGDNCIFREGVSIHAASNNETPTRIGDRVYFMVNSHAGHDVTVGNDVILVNNTGLGGHSEVQDRALLSGGTMVHQFGRVGRQAMTSGMTALTNDLPPYFTAIERNNVVGLNLVGMRRSGMSKDEIAAVRSAFSEVFRKNPPQQELRAMLAERAETSNAVREIYDFVISSKRPICPFGGRKVTRASDVTPINAQI